MKIKLHNGLSMFAAHRLSLKKLALFAALIAAFFAMPSFAADLNAWSHNIDNQFSGAYTLIMDGAAIGGVILVFIGGYGLFIGRKNDPQTWKVGYCLGMMVFGGILLSGSAIAYVMNTSVTGSDSSSSRPSFMQNR